MAGILKLLEEIEIKGVKFRNRVCMPAMHLHYSPDGFMSERYIKYYLERAKGGVGLITVGVCNVDPFFDGMGGMLQLCDEKYVDGMKRLVDAVHEEGARIFLQITARYLGFKGDATFFPRDHIDDMIKSFEKGAMRAVKVGFDGIELIGSGGSSLSAFMSGTNPRNDEYGGSFENRMRFVERSVEAAREGARDILLSFRMHGHEFLDGGYGLEEAREIAKLLVSWGVDIINVTGGGHTTRVPQITMFVPPAGYAFLAKNIKDSVDVPVIASNRFQNPVHADIYLVKGWADMVNFGRALHADPYLVRKIQEENLDEIVPCIACSQGCFDNVVEMKPSECLVNPFSGREYEWRVEKSKRRKKVLIIGGGPAGMECAIVCAQRGHEVVLYEKKKQLGGTFSLATKVPYKEAFLNFIEWGRRQMQKAGVKIMLNTEVTKEVVVREKPDVVVVATGAEPVYPSIPGLEKNPKVVNAWDVLSGKVKVGKKVIIIGGGATGCEVAYFISQLDTLPPEVAHFLQRYGYMKPDVPFIFGEGKREIVMLEVLPKIGSGIGRSTRWNVISELRREGVKMLTEVNVKEIKDDSVIVDIKGEEKTFEADTIIIATGVKSVRKIADELLGNVGELYVIGDANKPRDAMEAVRDGAEVAMKI